MGLLPFQKSLTIICSFFVLTETTIYTDSGCACAITKGTLSTPNASSTVNAGCSFKQDWNAQNTEWCLADQTNGFCGSLQPGFGYVDSCAQAALTSVSLAQAPTLEWDQDSTTYYTGQTLNVSWDFQNIGIDEWVRVWYQGVNQRVLTTGSGVNISSKFFSVRLSDSNNAPTSGKVPLYLNLPSTASIVAQSPQNISVIQSKLTNAFVYDGTRQLVTGQSAVCDDRNVSITWRGLGQAQIGLASTYIRSSFGSGTIVSGTVSNIPASANMTVNYTLPRTFTPFGGATYYAVITVQEPGQNAYTVNSASFSLSAAPSQSPSNSATPTPSKTPTPSITPTSSVSSSPSNTRTPTPTPSPTPSPSSSPSNTRTPTASITPTISPTPSTTETARPSIDLGAIAAAAADSAKEQQNAVTGAIVGSIGGIIIVFGTVKYFLTRKQMEMRRNRMKMSARFAMDADRIYGVQRTVDPIPASSAHVEAVVMYSLKHPQSTLTSKTKSTFPPTTNSL